MKRFLRDNGLSIAMFGAFAASAVGLVFVGWDTFNQEQEDHGHQAVGLVDYLTSADFGEALFENWESEFLQMGAYVLLTAFLFQRGSSESKDPDESEGAADDTAQKSTKRDAPWPVRRGGLALAIYRHSLSIALLTFFAFSFVLHLITGAGKFSEEQLAHGGEPVTAVQYLFTSQFWFESLQNWQSEFLAVGVLIVLSIFLRQKNSPESKAVAAPHSQTGT
ncbi:MAG TPA: DUF6766 family protein [Candidatus Limnocylindria bacterium]|nr:DUF6766 family protein [Candidatus Limnocylindria bacterium]